MWNICFLVQFLGSYSLLIVVWLRVVFMFCLNPYDFNLFFESLIIIVPFIIFFLFCVLLSNFFRNICGDCVSFLLSDWKMGRLIDVEDLLSCLFLVMLKFVSCWVSPSALMEEWISCGIIAWCWKLVPAFWFTFSHLSI